jgi:hypothetical protein
MRVCGDLAMQQNQVQEMALQMTYDWPTNPVAGQIAFINKVVYICAEIVLGLPVWVPMTREVEMYVYIQSVAANQWNITHDLNTAFVLVQTFDGNNQMVLPNNITILNANQVQIDYTGAAAGRAVILSGSLEGNQKPTYAVEWNQANPQTNWVITHNLGYMPVVRIFIGSYEVQPASIVHDSSNQVTISFLTPQQGVAKLI